MKPLYKIHIERDMKRYKDQLRSLAAIPERIRALEEEFTAIRAASVDGEPVSGGGTNRREEALIDNIDMRTRLENSLSVAEQDVQRINESIERLSDREQFVFKAYYIDDRSVEWIVDQLHLEKSMVYYIKEDAERRMATMEYGDAAN